MWEERGKIFAAAELFFQSLQAQELIQHPDVFIILDDVAEKYGYNLVTEQSNIRGTKIHLHGTFMHFVPK